MVDQLELDRWTELQFYYICADLLSLRNNMMDVMDIIDSLAIFNTYSPELVKPLAQEIIAAIRYRPSREEFIILCRKQGVPTRKIKKITNIHNRTLYEVINAEAKEPRMFYPRFDPEKIKIIEQFIETFKKLREVGLK